VCLCVCETTAAVSPRDARGQPAKDPDDTPEGLKLIREPTVFSSKGLDSSM